MSKTVLALFLSLASIVPGSALAEDLKRTHLLTLQGHGEVKTKPDMALVEIGTLSQASSAKAALAANTAQLSAIFAMLKANNIDDKDIQSSNFSVGPRYDNGSIPGHSPKIVGYDVTNSVIVTVHKLADLGGILDQAVELGSNQINNIAFGVNDPQPLQDEARKSAVADALRRAKLLAEAANTKLGAVASITEGGNSLPLPMRVRGMQMEAKMANASAPVPMAQGEMTISADVNVVWELE